jgi:hypothetical protein
MIPRTRLLAAAAACAAIALPAIGASPAAATATCKGANSPEYPNGYYTKLVVTGISCAGGKDVMHGHYKCRIKNGRKGRCPSFNGWSCSEKRRSGPTEFSSRVTCTKGNRKVVYYYSQDL